MLWAELCESVRSRYHISNDQASSFVLHWQRADSASWTQEVRAELVSTFAEPWVVLRAALGDQNFSAEAALAHNVTLPYGSLVLLDGQMVLQCAYPLRILDASELDRILRFLAWATIEIRRKGLSIHSDQSTKPLAFWV